MVLFALQGDAITSNPLDVVRIALPLLAYFALMFAVGMRAGSRAAPGLRAHRDARVHRRGQQLRARHRGRIGTFGVTSGQALAGVVGPLIEVPVLVGLVYVALWARRFFPGTQR